MKKRVFAALLVFALTLALLPAGALAVGTFADVTDETTARNVEVLRLLGVISGDGNGNFRPYGNLTRAEFCKMTIELQGRGAQVAAYRSRTIFPDVRPSHWAAGYVNLAATVTGENEPGLMHGFPDGTFRPDKTISYGEAVTVLMRVLGYSDKDSGGLWPQGYIDLGAAKGLTRNLSLGGADVITRAEAAQLFVNALSADKSGGGTLMKLGDETVLLSVDLAKGTMRTADGKDPKMANPTLTTLFNGLKGRVIYNDKDEAVSFLPSAAQRPTPGALSDTAVILAEDGSVDAFDALTGGVRDYTIYRNGNRVTPKALKRYDVATWSPSTKTILVCDTRVRVYYEDFMPSRTAPVTITALGGTEFPVLPSGRQSVSQFKPGQEMILLLTVDGQVAGAVASGLSGANSNAMGYVDAAGKVTMFCGGSTLAVKGSAPDKAGQVVRISQTKDGVYFTPDHNRVHGDVDLTTWTIGSYSLADNVLVLQEDGAMTSLSVLEASRIDATRIVYARPNEQNKIDLIVLGYPSTGNYLFGRAIIHTETDWEGDESYTIEIDCGPLGVKGPYPCLNTRLNTGDYVEAEEHKRPDGEVVLYGLMALEKVPNVTRDSWLGTDTVTVNGVTHGVAANTPCWCADKGVWFKSVKEAIDYEGTMNLYLDKHDVVRVIEVIG